MQAGEYISIDDLNPSEHFAVRLRDDSMTAIFKYQPDEAIFVLKKQDYALNNDVIVAIHKGDPILRRFKVTDGAIFLMADNSKYEPIFVKESDDFMILGKAVEMRIKL